jgi:hypothetical protein
MIKCLLIFILCLSSTLGLGQSFEGKITYDLSYSKSESSNAPIELLAMTFGKKRDLYIKEGYYHAVSDGMIVDEVYNRQLNRIYLRTANDDSYISFDANYSGDSLISHRIIDDPGTSVLGEKCAKLEMTTKKGTIHVYYSKKYPINKAPFLNIKYNFWGFIVGTAGAVPLKTIITENGIAITSEARDIEVRKLREDEAITVP